MGVGDTSFKGPSHSRKSLSARLHTYECMILSSHGSHEPPPPHPTATGELDSMIERGSDRSESSPMLPEAA